MVFTETTKIYHTFELQQAILIINKEERRSKICRHKSYILKLVIKSSIHNRKRILNMLTIIFGFAGTDGLTYLTTKREPLYNTL